jgi:hypothetical protein
MKPTEQSPDEQEQPNPPRENAEKLVIKGVITHDRLLTEIEARNPIIAHRQK